VFSYFRFADWCSVGPLHLFCIAVIVRFFSSVRDGSWYRFPSHWFFCTPIVFMCDPIILWTLAGPFSPPPEHNSVASSNWLSQRTIPSFTMSLLWLLHRCLTFFSLGYRIFPPFKALLCLATSKPATLYFIVFGLYPPRRPAETPLLLLPLLFLLPGVVEKISPFFRRFLLLCRPPLKTSPSFNSFG